MRVKRCYNLCVNSNVIFSGSYKAVHDAYSACYRLVRFLCLKEVYLTISYVPDDPDCGQEIFVLQ